MVETEVVDEVVRGRVKGHPLVVSYNDGGVRSKKSGPVSLVVNA